MFLRFVVPCMEGVYAFQEGERWPPTKRVETLTAILSGAAWHIFNACGHTKAN